MSDYFDQERQARVWAGLSRRISRRKRAHEAARWLAMGAGSLAVSALLLHTVIAKADHTAAAHGAEAVQVSALLSGDGGLRAD